MLFSVLKSNKLNNLFLIKYFNQLLYRRFKIQKSLYYNLYIKSFQFSKMDKNKMQKIKQQAAKLGTSYYKFVEPFIININDKIGRGSYGQVFKGADIRTGQLVAVKTISTSNIKKDPQKFYESLKNEIQIMKSIKNENIVELFDVKKSSNNIYLFQQLCNRGSLEDILQKRKKLPENQVIMIMKQLIDGYKYLHEHSVIHRDLKPANILIKDQIYKIADFGFAKFYQEGSQLDQIHQSLVGSPMYMCPQILNGSSYSTKSDVWSMGVIFFQMLYGRTPHKASSLEELISKVNKKQIKIPQKLKNEDAQNLIQRMLRFEPQERISWKQIFENPLFIKKQHKSDIKESMKRAEMFSKNKLEMSQKMNQIYFEDKKIIQQIQITKQDDKKQLSTIVASTEASQPKDQDLYKSIAQKYEQTQMKKAIIRKIKNWFLFKRNKAVFLNHLSLKIHNLFAAEKLSIPLWKAQIFILVLSKWQCMITYKSYIRLKQGKINSKAFSEEEYQLFVNSSLREKIMQKFKNDFTVMKMFFDELMKKVQSHLNKWQGQLPENLKRIKKICNQALCPKDLFVQIYNETIDELNLICRDSLKSANKDRQMIQLAYLVTQALKLKKDELETNQFSMIYDQQEKLSDDDLIKKIEGKIVEVD